LVESLCDRYDIHPGDLVVSVQDEMNGFDVVGLVMETKYRQAYIWWCSESAPCGWWHFHQLRKTG